MNQLRVFELNWLSVELVPNSAKHPGPTYPMIMHMP